jgi:trimethylamine--corrinoid protein Co-methyltransferase
MSLPQVSTTSPATIAADTLLVNAENLACQLIARAAAADARIFYSSDAGAPNLFDAGIDYENSEYVLLSAADCDMARFYDLPSAMGCSVEFKDFSNKAGFERNVFRCALKLLTRVDVACWVGTRNSCLSSSLIDVMLDLEVCRHAKAYFRNFEVNDETLALDIIAQQGPRGNYLDHEHTFKHFRENIFTDKAENCYLFADGYANHRQAAKDKMEAIIAEHQPPAFDEALVKEIDLIAAKAEKQFKK